MKEEVWKDIEGYEGLYQVSNFGRVRSLDRYVNHPKGKVLKKSKIISPGINKHNYKYVTLSKSNNKKTFRVHRLVAEAFIPNPLNLPCVNHKDEDKTNNHVDNLEWCTYEYNINYGTRTERHKNTIIPKKNPVLQLDLDGNIVNEFESLTEAYEKTGFYKTNISRVCKNLPKYKTYKGFKWKYKENG